MSSFDGFMIDTALRKDREIAALEEKVRTLTARAEAAEKKAQSAELEAEGLRKALDAINEIIFRAENAAMACDQLQPTVKMIAESDIAEIFKLSMYALASPPTGSREELK